jgi:hypothetical protein
MVRVIENGNAKASFVVVKERDAHDVCEGVLPLPVVTAIEHCHAGRVNEAAADKQSMVPRAAPSSEVAFGRCEAATLSAKTGGACECLKQFYGLNRYAPH